MPAAASYPPRLMGEDEAARYLGISANALRAAGLPRRVIGRRRLYDVLSLDRYADSLPTDRDEPEENSCDQAFSD